MKEIELKRYIVNITYNNDDYDEFEFDSRLEAIRFAKANGVGKDVKRCDVYDIVKEEYVAIMNIYGEIEEV